MTDPSAPRPKLLFVISNDFGELANAMVLVLGCDFQVVLLLPNRLLAANALTLAYPARGYRTIDDVLQAVDDVRPDVVFLFSGYLYSINQIFSVKAVEQLAGQLQRRGCRVVTSDPFLGVMSRIDDSTFSDRHPAKRWLMDHFAELDSVLKEVPHLYLVDLKGTVNKSVSFFNANILQFAGQRSGGVSSIVKQDSRTEEMSTPGLPEKTSTRHWLFVLSFEDYSAEVARVGRTSCHERLLGMFRLAERAGRHAVLIGPEQCTTALDTDGQLPQGTILQPYCGFDPFWSLLFDAEYVFYWNIFSNSVAARVVNRLPVFFFGRGHMAEAIPALFEVGMQRYYCGTALPYLDLTKTPSLEILAALAARQVEEFAAARSQFQRSPGPVEMIARILAG